MAIRTRGTKIQFIKPKQKYNNTQPLHEYYDSVENIGRKKKGDKKVVITQADIDAAKAEFEKRKDENTLPSAVG